MKLLTNNQHSPTNKMVFGRGILNATAAIVLSATIAIDATAQPIYIDEIDSNSMTSMAVSDSLLETVDRELPAGRNVNAAFLNPSYTPWVTMSESGQVLTTFVDEGAGYRNSLGYFTFNNDTFNDLSKQDIDTDGSGVVSLSELDAVNGVDTGWVFPNASKAGAGGQLKAGDTVALGGGEFFEAGTNIGFMLVQDGWVGSSIDSPETAQMLYGVDFLNPEAAASATILTNSSTNSSRHVAVLFEDESESQIIMGFEDLNRTDRYSNVRSNISDEDFNDAIFIIHSNPVTAIRGSNIATADASVPEPSTALLLALGLCGLVLKHRQQTTCN